MAVEQMSSIETEIEQTRDRLASTIDQLVHRVSPKTIAQRQVASVKGCFVDPTGAPRQDNIIKVAGGTVGVIALLVVVRKLVS
ncbi:MAG: DUF3618 domain-containing protein [Actinomycetota bacterium]|nr:DUF3618 domain-containing protein [Actinomycetota bacterium]